jgi:hypothetical protein
MFLLLFTGKAKETTKAPAKKGKGGKQNKKKRASPSADKAE